MSEVVNKLAYVTCPHCGYSFKVAVSPSTKHVKGYYLREGNGTFFGGKIGRVYWQGRRQKCANCGEEFDLRESEYG